VHHDQRPYLDDPSVRLPAIHPQESVQHHEYEAVILLILHTVSASLVLRGMYCSRTVGRFCWRTVDNLLTVRKLLKHTSLSDCGRKGFQPERFGLFRAIKNSVPNASAWRHYGSLCSSTTLPFPMTEVNAMQGKSKELWKQFCEQAAVEQDPDKLIRLIAEINRMLEEKEYRLKPTRQKE
jgi:hypothetical protein